MSKPPNPKRVKDSYAFWNEPPPELSERCRWWIQRYESGWRPNRRIRSLGYDPGAHWYGVYVWEYLNIIRPLEEKLCPTFPPTTN